MAFSDDDEDPTTNLLDEEDGNTGFDDVVHSQEPAPHGSAFLQETDSPSLGARQMDDSPPPFSLASENTRRDSPSDDAVPTGSFWGGQQQQEDTDDYQQQQPSLYSPPKVAESARKNQVAQPSYTSTAKADPSTTAKKRGMEEEVEQRASQKDIKKVPSAPPAAALSMSEQHAYPIIPKPQAQVSNKPKPALETRVNDPRVVGSGTHDKHVEYRVDTTVETSLAQISFDGQTKFSVFRRFSDFYWLRDTLEQKYPGFIIPPLPDKTLPYLQNNLSEKFFLSRARSLDYFLAHVAAHSVLSRDVALKDFLIAEQGRFEQVRKPSLSVDGGAPAAVQAVSTATAGLFEKVFDWGQNIGTTLNSTISGAARAGAQRRERDTSDDRFDEAQRYVNELEPKIKFVYDIAKQLVDKNQTLSKVLHELGLAFTNMGQSEQQVQLSDAVTELGNVCNGREGLSVLVNLLAEKEQVKFLEPIEDYVRLVASAKQALNVRIRTALAYEYALGDLTLKRAAREKMPPDDSRIPTADGEILEAQRKAESAKTDFEMVTDRVLKEIERFKREKSQDFKALILQYVQLQIDHNQAVELLWRSVLPKLHSVKAPGEQSANAFTGDDV